MNYSVNVYYFNVCILLKLLLQLFWGHWTSDQNEMNSNEKNVYYILYKIMDLMINLQPEKYYKYSIEAN